MVSHSCSGRNSFVDITSNQAQPLSNFLSHPTRPTTPSNSHWGEGAVRRLQAATPAKPSKLGERRREDTPVSAGDQTQCSVDLGDQTQHFQVAGAVLDMHRGKQPLNMVLYNVRKVFNIPVSTESTCLLFLDIYTETSYLLFLQGDYFDWFRPKNSKCWRWQNPY